MKSRNSFFFHWGRKNIAGKGENTGYQHFLLFPQCFRKDSFFRVVKKSGLCGVELNNKILDLSKSKAFSGDKIYTVKPAFETTCIERHTCFKRPIFWHNNPSKINLIEPAFTDHLHYFPCVISEYRFIYCIAYMTISLWQCRKYCWKRRKCRLLQRFLSSVFPPTCISSLTHYQMTNFRLFQIERACRWQFQIWQKWKKVIQTGRKHCGKRRNCSLRAISPFPTVFSKGLFPWGTKRRHCVGMG